VGKYGTKDPQYSDVLWALKKMIADTVNTTLPATLASFRNHGHPHSSLSENLDIVDDADASTAGNFLSSPSNC